jgi:hypothetical protein
MSSIDGKGPVQAFNDEYVPFMLQSPLNVYMPILSTAYFMTTAERVDIDKSVECVTTRGKIITLINEHLSKRKGITDEVLIAVMSMASIEVVTSTNPTLVPSD